MSAMRRSLGGDGVARCAAGDVLQRTTANPEPRSHAVEAPAEVIRISFQEMIEPDECEQTARRGVPEIDVRAEFVRDAGRYRGEDVRGVVKDVRNARVREHVLGNAIELEEIDLVERQL